MDIRNIQEVKLAWSMEGGDTWEKDCGVFCLSDEEHKIIDRNRSQKGKSVLGGMCLILVYG